MLSLFTTIANADGHAKANAFAITLKVPASDVAKVEEMLKTHPQMDERNSSNDR